MTRSNDNQPATPGDDWTMPINPAKPGLGRRTILTGAAWSIPVITLAVATPMATASETRTLQLTFTAAPYTVAACGVLVGAGVVATYSDGSAVPAGQAVTVTLPVGYTWANNGGSEARTYMTDAYGEVTLDDITVTATGGPLSASSGGVVAAGPVVVTANPTVTVLQWNPITQKATTVASGFPADSVTLAVGTNPITAGRGYGAVLGANGDLYSQEGVKLASGVVDYEAFASNGIPYIRYLLSDGTVRQYQAVTKTTSTVGAKVPGAVSIEVGTNPASGGNGTGAVLTNAGDLYLQDGVTKLATGVVDYEVFTSNGQPYVRYVLADGTVRQYNSVAKTTSTVGAKVPGAVSIGVGTNPVVGGTGTGAVLTSSGDLFLQDGTTKLATGVIDYEVYVANGVPFVRYLLADGTVRQYNVTAKTTAAVGTVPGATTIEVGTNPIAAGTGIGAALTNGGDLYNTAGPIKLASNVVDYETFVYKNIPFVRWIQRDEAKC